MNRFPGFPNRPNYVAIPRVFFSDILPFIQDMAELLVTLQLFRLLGAKRGYPRAAAYHELMEDRALVTGFSQLGRDFRDAIPQGLETAVQRGTFLRVTPPMGEPWILLNSDQNRRAAPAIPRGRWCALAGTSLRRQSPCPYRSRTSLRCTNRPSGYSLLC